MKKLLLPFLAVCLLTALLTTTALADERETMTGMCGPDATWEFNRYSGVMTIEGSGKITTLPTIGVLGPGIKSLTIGEGITSIEDGVRFANLEALYLPNSLEYIGSSVFENSYITDITMPESLKSIGEDAFSGSYFTTVTLNEGLTEIAEGAFAACGALKSINIPDSVTNIGRYAFAGTAIEEIEFPASIRNISDYILSSPEFGQNDSLKRITFNEGLQTIGDNAFENCVNLREVEIPNSVKSIGSYAFSGCELLSDVTLGDSLEVIGHFAFSMCAIENVELPQSLKTIGTNSFSINKLTQVSIPASVTSIGYSSFYKNESLSSVIFNENSQLELIGADAFKECTSLTSISLPAKLKTIEYEAFKDCTSLETIELNNGLETIDRGAFENTALKSVAIPDSVTFLGESAFSRCAFLENVTLSDRIPVIQQSTFTNCIALKSIKIPDTVTSIGDYVFQGCSSLRSVITGKFINSVGSSSFSGCAEGLTIYGYSGSYMETYAHAYDIRFVSIGNAESSESDVSGGETNGIEDMSSAPGLDKDGRPCTVVTVTMADGSEEVFYVYGETEPVAGGFADVPVEAYYADAVSWALAEGVTTGTGAGRFSPDAGCTRAQVVTFLWRAMGCPEPSGTASFSDVSGSDYYAGAVAWAAQSGVTSGAAPGVFSPNAVCTRAQVVTFLARALGAGGGWGASGFADVSAAAYYADAVAWAVASGVTSGTSANAFSPDAACTRAQIVTFLYRALA